GETGAGGGGGDGAAKIFDALHALSGGRLCPGDAGLVDRRRFHAGQFRFCRRLLPFFSPFMFLGGKRQRRGARRKPGGAKREKQDMTEIAVHRLIVLRRQSRGASLP